MMEAMRCFWCGEGLHGWYEDGMDLVECHNDDCAYCYEAFTVAEMKQRIEAASEPTQAQFDAMYSAPTMREQLMRVRA